MTRTIEELSELVRSYLEEESHRPTEEQFCILAGMTRMDARVCDTKAFTDWTQKNSDGFWAHDRYGKSSKYLADIVKHIKGMQPEVQMEIMCNVGALNPRIADSKEFIEWAKSEHMKPLLRLGSGTKLRWKDGALRAINE